MSQRVTRRDFMRIAGTTLAGAALASCTQAPAVAPAQSTSAPAQPAGPANLRVGWWGGEARAKMMNEMFDAAEKAMSDVKFTREFADWAGYWDKLATQVAGGNAPDIIFHHITMLGEYAERGALLKLTPLVDAGIIDLKDVPQGVNDTGKYNGEFYMVNFGITGPACQYNKTIMDKVGIGIPSATWNWDDFKKAALDWAKNGPKETLYTSDQGAWDALVEIYIRQRGEALFDGNALGFSKQTLVDFWTMWEEIRKAGACPSAEVTAEKGSAPHPEHMFSKDEVALHFMNANQLKIYQENNTTSELGIDFIPRGDKNGDILAGVHIAISSKAQNPEAAGKVLSWIVNAPEAVSIYKAEHGLPASTKMKDVVMPLLPTADQKALEYVTEMTKVGSVQANRPKSASAVLKALTLAYSDASFGKVTVKEAVDRFFSEAETAMV